MVCPSCGYDNMEGADRCEECLTPLRQLDVPRADGAVGLARSVMEDDLSELDQEFLGLSSNTSALDAIETMKQLRVGCALVIDDGKLVGIFTERDVLRKLALSSRDPHDTPVRDLMTTPVELATVATGPGEALATMIDRHFRHLPIVDPDGRLLGMLSIRNVLQWRIDDLSQELDSLEQYVANDGPGG